MIASEMIEQLASLIEKHGDLPVAMLEVSESGYRHYFIESDGVDGVYELEGGEILYDVFDDVSKHRKVFLLD